MCGQLLVAGLLVAATGSLARAEEPRGGDVPRETLAALGLGGIESMNDADAAQVRGRFTFAFSRSAAAGVIRFSSNPPPSTSNPASASSWAVGIIPGVRYSAGYAKAAAN